MTKKEKVLLFLIISGLVLFLDQSLKYLVYKYQPNYSLGIIQLKLLTNTGAGFGILQGQTFFLIIISTIVTGSIIYYYPKIASGKSELILFALLLGGTVGNLIDRIFRGYVIDFINFQIWPAFNLADAVISFAVIGLIIGFWKKT